MAYGRSIRWKKSIKGFSDALGYTGEHLSNWAKDWMSESVSQAISEIDADWPHHSEGKSYFGGSIKVLDGAKFGGDRFHPWFTGQLHDSIVGIVSDKHKIVSMDYMPQSAGRPQTYQGQVIIGHVWAEQKALEVARVLRFLPGIYATIVVGVPYADDVDESARHAGFIRELSNQFASSVEDQFMIRGQGFRTRTFVADKKKK